MSLPNLSFFTLNIMIHLQNASGLHLSNHLHSEEEGDGKVGAEGDVLEAWVHLLGLGGVGRH